MLGVWQTGAAGRREALAPAMRAAYARELPDVRDQDVAGSPFAIAGLRRRARAGWRRARWRGCANACGRAGCA